jgi:Eukaryotic aspartyl protease.
MAAVTVDGTDTGLKNRTAILDTGTTLIVAPLEDATALHKTIAGAKSDGQGGFTVPCSTKASVALTFGNTQFAIDPRDLAFLPLNPNDPNGDCVSGISAGKIRGATEWLVSCPRLLL